MSKKLLFLFLAICFINRAFSQKTDYRFKHLTDINGLSHSSVKSIIQDHEGYMWFGTMDGLNKYDGNKIKIYKNSPKDSTSLIGSEIYDLLEDHEKNLWVGTRNGLCLYLRDKDQFKFQQELGNIKITDLYEDRDHNLWFGSGHSLYKYNKDKKIFEKRVETFIKDHIKFIYEDRERNFWIGTYRNIFLFDRNKEILVPQTHIEIKDINNVFEDSKKNFWMASNDQGLILYDRATKMSAKIKHDPNNSYSILSNTITSISEDAKGRLWIGCQNGGLSIYEKDKATFYNYSNDPGDPESLSFNTIDCFYKDRNNDLWLGTFSGGVNFVKERKFALFRNNPFSKTSLSNNNILSMLEDRKGNIWIGTDGGGLNMLNKKTGEFKVFQHDPKNPKGIKSNAVTSITEDKDGTIWLGYWAGGVDRLDLEKQEFIAYKHQKDFPNLSWANECTMHLYEDNKSNLWAATLYQLELLNKKTGHFTSYVIPGSGLDNIVCAIHEDNEGDLWIGTYLGLHLLDRATKERVRYVHSKEDSSSLSNDKIYTIFEDSKKRMWVGTSDGLNLFNKKDKNFTVFRTDDGLPSNAIYAILEDKKGNFWLSTGNGICRYNPDTKETKTFTVSDGLQGNEFKQHAALKLRSGEMLFGGAKGFNLFDPEKIQANPNVPPVVFTDLKIFNKSLPIGTAGTPFEKHISQVKELNLSFKESVLSFDFAALNYISPEKNEYAYILEPFEKEWNYVGRLNTATYTNLDPGKYTLKVKASNNDGVWNEQGTALSIIITPPFWQTIWFRALLTMMIIAITFTVFKVRVNIIERQKKVLEKEVEKRTFELSEANTELHQQKEVLSDQAGKLTQQASNLNTAYNEIKRQREVLETVYNDTKDNIRAAYVIQNTILPSVPSIKNHLPEIFILNKPKDVVSGDFYWFQEVADAYIIAAVDCTGHGVSGAFMSIIGHNLLNQIINSTSILVASDILNRLNDAVIKQLHQDDRHNGSTEGMDISLSILNKDKKSLQYSGANNPLYIVRNGELIQIKGDRFSIGKSLLKKTKEFTNHFVDLQKGDVIYMFSDGYADQTGGPEGEKFMYSQFRDLLTEISITDMERQEEILDGALSNWQGEVDQLDDILVIGFKI